MSGLARMEMEAANPTDASATSDSSDNLLVAHRDGDPSAFRKLVEQYRRPVFGYLVHSAVAPHDREDVFQDIFIKIHQSAHQYDDTRPLHPWLFTVVANTVRSYLRKQKVRQLFIREPVTEDVRDDAPDGEAMTSEKETKTWLARAIKALPTPQREVLILATIENLPLKDIASMLGLPLNTVKTHVRRARARLADGYERRTRVSS